MLKIIGRLMGLKGEELKYNKEILVFMIISASIFLILGLVHTKQGSEIVYANKLNVLMLSKSENEGISNEDINNIIEDYKETVPINISEFEVYDIKDRVDNYIDELKNKNNRKLNKIIDKLEEVNKLNKKETLIENLKQINLEEMLKKISKTEITKEKLKGVASWQENIFLAIVYLGISTIISFAAIMVKIFCNIDLSSNKKDTSPKNLYR
ncbi:hypothetical protein G8S55_07200 [Clostridium botulinum C]|uniref:hypothetical protein n=1 Tax=Clostridium botulinum TaxID=1491 RepID=UPI001E3A5302|nr:hypothetical protein [Clostridium botulinum]MCD3217040.1 hypothetical protein [Clostridium botulinum C]